VAAEPALPDSAVRIIDQSFARYRLNLAAVERIAHGFAGARDPCVRRRALSAVARHPRQPDHEVEEEPVQ